MSFPARWIWLPSNIMEALFALKLARLTLEDAGYAGRVHSEILMSFGRARIESGKWKLPAGQEGVIEGLYSFDTIRHDGETKTWCTFGPGDLVLPAEFVARAFFNALRDQRGADVDFAAFLASVEDMARKIL